MIYQKPILSTQTEFRQIARQSQGTKGEQYGQSIHSGVANHNQCRSHWRANESDARGFSNRPTLSTRV